MLIYMGIFAFANPDKAAWIGYSKEENLTLYPTNEAASTASATQVINIHARFVSWFVWGFYMLWAPLVIITMVTCGFMVSNNLGIACSVCTLGSACCSSTFWFIFGFVWRFSDYGRFASGAKVPEGVTEQDWYKQIHADESMYQTASGQFMKMYYIIGLIIILTPMLICLLTICIACCVAGAASCFMKGMTESSQDTLDVKRNDRQ